jgi:hypothetical protein
MSFKPALNGRSLRIASKTSRKSSSRISSMEDCREIRVGSQPTDRTKAHSSRG